MTLTLPLAPYRPSLAMVLTALGREAEAAGAYTCGCGRHVMAAGFYDVRDQPDSFGGQPFVCQTCASDLMRREDAAHAEAVRLAKEAVGVLDDERLNDLRAQRETALARSDWTQLADNRDRIGPVMSARWDEYRAAWRAWFSTARDTGVIGPTPDLPKEPEAE